MDAATTSKQLDTNEAVRKDRACRIAELAAMGVLTKNGGGNTATYPSTGLL
jgi:phage portal protein BeeE